LREPAVGPAPRAREEGGDEEHRGGDGDQADDEGAREQEHDAEHEQRERGGEHEHRRREPEVPRLGVLDVDRDVARRGRCVRAAAAGGAEGGVDRERAAAMRAVLHSCSFSATRDSITLGT
jgi:hypothetical protein